MSVDDTRAKSIIHWLTQTLKLEIKHFEPASSDASFRRYFRVIHSKGQQIVMDAPPELENISAFIHVAELFKKSKLRVPDIIQQDLDQGFLLLEDFGCLCFLDQLNANNATELYTAALNSLYKLQTETSITQCGLPEYNEELLEKELGIFYQWFLQQKLTLSIPTAIKNTLNSILISSALEQPQVCVHRDFHSRNLMLLSNHSAGIIDFQDAVIGPITYDLVSLLRDCYIAWPEENIQLWMQLYFQKISQTGLLTSNLALFTRWFDLMGLQRHLKAIGIFSRLQIRDNKPSYLADIPRTLNYVNYICSKYPELTEFNHYLINIIVPAYNTNK